MQRLSTHDVPARDRLPYLHDFVARHVAGLRFRPMDSDSFAFDVSAYFLDSGTTVGTACYSAVRGERPRDLLAVDGRQDYLMTIHTSDYEVAIEGRSPLVIRAGDITLVNEATPMAFTLPETLLKVAALDEARLAALAPRVRVQAFHHISSQAAGAALLTGYTDLLRAAAPDGEAGRRLAGNHLYDLAALAIQGGSADAAARPSLGTARLELVKADMLRHLTDPELGITAVARRQGVTPRYIQHLFGLEGLTFSEFLRDARLDLALKALQGASTRIPTISAIAYDAGFGDLSYFNRAFRRRFGATPKEVRAAALVRQ